jgi:hypothetical protein
VLVVLAREHALELHLLDGGGYGRDRGVYLGSDLGIGGGELEELTGVGKAFLESIVEVELGGYAATLALQVGSFLCVLPEDGVLALAVELGELFF